MRHARGVPQHFVWWRFSKTIERLLRIVRGKRIGRILGESEGENLVCSVRVALREASKARLADLQLTSQLYWIDGRRVTDQRTRSRERELGRTFPVHSNRLCVSPVRHRRRIQP